jgi:hypothetical protein
LPPAKHFILSHRARLSHIPFHRREAMVTCARIQSSHAAWCCPLEIRRGSLPTSSCIEWCLLCLHSSMLQRVYLVLSFWISSFTCCGTVASSSLYWHHVYLFHLVIIALLLPLLCGFTPASRTKHIPKYSSIEKFIKLSFQWVLICLNWSPNEGAMAVSLQHCLLSRISACATIGDSAISACRNLRLPFRLIRWNVEFIELLKIQIYPVFFLLRLCKASWWHHYPFVHRSGDVRVVFILKSFRAPCHAYLSFFSIVLDMVISETYSLNKQSSKRH